MRTAFKKTVTNLCVLLLYAACIQGQELIGKLYQTKVPVIVRNVYATQKSAVPKDSTISKRKPVNWTAPTSFKVDSTDTKINPEFCEAKRGYVFQVIGIDSNRVIIRWWDFTQQSRDAQKKKEADTTLQVQENFVPISYHNTHLDYEITLDDLNSKCSPYYGNDNSFTWGAVTMPIKLRLGNKSDRYFSFQESLNIGIGAGWSWQKQGRHQKSRNLIFSVGVSNVILDSLDFKRNSKNETFQPNVKNTAAMTIAIGYFFQFDNFQVGAFTGIDMLPYQLGRYWVHKNKPWIGIGLGMSLFNRDHDKAVEGKNKD